MTHQNNDYAGLTHDELVARLIEAEKAEPVISNQDAQFRCLIENSPDATFVHSDGTIVFVNRMMVQLMSATSPEQLLGMESLDILHPDDRKRTLASRQTIIETGQPKDFTETRYQSLTGETFLVEASGTSIRWAGADAFMVVARDISKRRAVERANQRLKAIVEFSADAIVAATPEGIITDWNPAAEAMYGYTSSEAIGQSIMIISPEQLLGESNDVTASVAGGQYIKLMQTRRQRKDGTLIDVAMTISPFEDHAGNVVGLSSVHMDITNQTKATKALRASEERYKLLADLMPDGLMVVCDGKIVFANPCLLKIFGAASPSDMLGKLAIDFASPEAKADILERRKQLEAGQLEHLAEARHIRVDGTDTFVEKLVSPIVWEGKPAFLGIFRDINERRQVKDELRESQKLSALGQLTGGVAHEFNNMLMVVVGNIEMLKDKLPPDAELEKLSTRALKGAMRGADLTQSLLAYSRKQNLTVEPVDLNSLILSVLDMLHQTLEESITLKTELAENLPEVQTDSDQVNTALLNFVVNARDALPEGGEITVRTRKQFMDETARNNQKEPGEYIILEVLDNGAGMSADTAARAFEPFFTTKDIGKGTGLGLSMVYGFAQQSGGFSEIDSVPGQGATIRLCLPLNPQNDLPVSQSENPSAQKPGATGQKSILVVEDDPDVREIVTNLLEALGHQILQAEDGPSALALFETNPGIDLLFTDVVLPGGMTGIEIARQFHGGNPAIKVILTSGYPDRNIEDLEINGEKPVVISKPYRNIDLVGVLATIFEN
jgi:PAS domain S-box-containing protein